LFFAGVVLSAAASAAASPSLWLAALLPIVAAIAWQAERRPQGSTAITVALAAYSGWALARNLLGTSYTPAAAFHPMFAVAGFVVARAAGERERQRLCATFLAAAAMFSVWGLAQSLTGEGRARALFETPNTLATLLNLALAPLLFRIAYGETRAPLLAAAVVISAGFAATLSRGGAFALAAGLAAMVLFCPVRPQRRGISRALGLFLAGAGIGALALLLPQWLSAQPVASEGQVGSVGSTLVNSVGSRLELYRLALSAVGEHPWVGIGYLGFQPLLEAHRAEVPSYATENITYFVHDDYLQTLIELGVPGLAALLAMVVLPFWQARRLSASTTDPAPLYAPLAGMATMAIHALGDFPFYVPVCLLGFGMLLGQVDAGVSAPRIALRRRGMPARLALLAGAAAMAIILLPPPLAEAAAAYGDRSWREGKAESAAYGFELARRLQPRDWRYHWYAGQFWYAQARQGNRAAPPLADQAFAAAVSANPREPRPLLARLATQMRFAATLDHPEPVASLRRWADQALALAPLNPAVRRDHAAALEQLSRKP
jgi:O-antigen ligase